MKNFRPECPTIEGSVARFPSASESYRVIITVERRDGKNITDRDAMLAYTSALSLLTQMKSVGRV
jgi:hypothetical protein